MSGTVRRTKTKRVDPMDSSVTPLPRPNDNGFVANERNQGAVLLDSVGA